MLKPPPGTKSAGSRLWKAILADYELDEHELTLLRQAIRVADLCDDLQAILTAEGLMLTTADGGVRTHPAAVELRQQQVLLARLIVALRVPLGEQDSAGKGEQDSAGKTAPRTQRRGVRGVYAIRGGAA